MDMTMMMTQNKEYYHVHKKTKGTLLKGKKAVTKGDQDRVIIITGREGTGKSTLTMQFAHTLDKTFSINDIVFNAKDFSERIRTCKKFKAIVFDEAFNGLSSRSAISGENKKLVRLLQECRQRNLFIFIVLPSVFLLEKYVAIFRSHYLIHCQINKKNFQNRFYKIYNYHNKKILYILGHKYMDYSKPKINLKYNFGGKLPPTIDEKAYREKKRRAFVESDKVNESMENRAMKQVGILSNYLHDEFGVPYAKTSRHLKDHGAPLDASNVSRWAKKMREPPETTSEDTPLNPLSPNGYPKKPKIM